MIKGIKHLFKFLGVLLIAISLTTGQVGQSYLSQKLLVENTIKGQTNLFGRNQYMNSVIFEGEKNSIGKIVKVKILSSNQNTLFGKIGKTKDMRAA